MSCLRFLLCSSITQDDALLAYQVAFDLFDNDQQSFLLKARARVGLVL